MHVNMFSISYVSIDGNMWNYLIDHSGYCISKEDGIKFISVNRDFDRLEVYQSVNQQQGENACRPSFPM